MRLRTLGVRAGVVAASLGVIVAAGGVWAMDESDPDGAKPLTGTPARMAGTSSIAIKRYGTDTLVGHERNVSFRFFRGLMPMLLLREEIDTEDEVPWRGEGLARSSVELTARVVGLDGKAGAVRYRIHESGENAILYGDLYIVSLEGCCDSQDGHVVYSVETGKRLMYTTGSTPVGALESVPSRQPGQRARWVGVFAANSAYDDAVFTKSRDSLAVVTYATDSAPLMRVVLTRSQDRHESPPYFDRLEVREVPGNSGGDTSVTVHVQFHHGIFLDLPVTNDGLDVVHATGSDDVVARKLPLEAAL